LWVESPNSAFETMRTVSAINNNNDNDNLYYTTTARQLHYQNPEGKQDTDTDTADS
jgi:hypothetical protein